MTHRRPLLLSTLGLLAASAAAGCPQYDAVVAAVSAGETATATALYDQIVFSADCDEAIRDWVGDYLARASFAEAMAVEGAARRAALTRALGYETHWRSYAELGRLAFAEADYPAAAETLQLALNELSEGDQSHRAETSEIAEIYELAAAALLLSDELVRMPRTRSGAAGGILQTSIRSFEVDEVPLPITFEYNSTAFDALGAGYAQSLADHVLTFAPEAVTLAGHTDPRGGEAFNQELSEARAAALADFLRERGYQGEIRVEGYGESLLPPVPPGIVPDSEDYYRLARRVAFSGE